MNNDESRRTPPGRPARAGPSNLGEGASNLIGIGVFVASLVLIAKILDWTGQVGRFLWIPLFALSSASGRAARRASARLFRPRGVADEDPTLAGPANLEHLLPIGDERPRLSLSPSPRREVFPFLSGILSSIDRIGASIFGFFALLILLLVAAEPRMFHLLVELLIWSLAVAIATTGVLARWIKQRVLRHCAIGLFRPYRRRLALHSRRELAAALGCYGKLCYITDETLDDVGPDVKLFGLQDDLLTDHGQAPFASKSWREYVQSVVKELDLAVIDVTVPSPSVAWELKQCLQVLSPWRILLVAQEGDHGSDPVAQGSATALATGEPADMSELYGLIAEQPPLWYGAGRTRRAQFRRDLKRWMQNVEGGVRRDG